MVFTTEGLFEVAIESWPEWDFSELVINFRKTPLPTMAKHGSKGLGHITKAAVYSCSLK